MLSIPPTKFPKRRGGFRPRAVAPPAPPAQLLLVAAELLLAPAARVRLTFDRAVDVAGLDPSQISVDDPDTSGLAYVGTGVYDTPGPVSVSIALLAVGPATAGVTVMDATGNTGIVAVDDGGSWDGIPGQTLPFP